MKNMKHTLLVASNLTAAITGVKLIRSFAGGIYEAELLTGQTVQRKLTSQQRSLEYHDMANAIRGLA